MLRGPASALCYNRAGKVGWELSGRKGRPLALDADLGKATVMTIVGFGSAFGTLLGLALIIGLMGKYLKDRGPLSPAAPEAAEESEALAVESGAAEEEKSD